MTEYQKTFLEGFFFGRNKFFRENNIAVSVGRSFVAGEEGTRIENIVTGYYLGSEHPLMAERVEYAVGVLAGGLTKPLQMYLTLKRIHELNEEINEEIRK